MIEIRICSRRYTDFLQKIVMIVLLSCVSGFAVDDNKEIIAEVIQKAENVLEIKAGIFIKDLKSNKSYLNHLHVKIGNKTVFDATASNEIHQRTLMAFYTLDNANESEVEFILTYNTGEVSHYFSKINRNPNRIHDYSQVVYSKSNHIDSTVHNYKDSHPEVWKAKSFENAIKEFYGLVKIIETENKALNYDGTSEIYVDKPNPVIFKIYSEKNLESIMILTTGGEYVTKAIIRIPENENVGYGIEDNINPLTRNYKKTMKNGLISFEFPEIVLDETQKVEIVSRTRDGQVYRQRLNLKFRNYDEVSYLPAYIKL